MVVRHQRAFDLEVLVRLQLQRHLKCVLLKLKLLRRQQSLRRDKAATATMTHP
jgi:hypothetical protein